MLLYIASVYLYVACICVCDHLQKLPTHSPTLKPKVGSQRENSMRMIRTSFNDDGFHGNMASIGSSTADGKTIDISSKINGDLTNMGDIIDMNVDNINYDPNESITDDDDSGLYNDESPLESGLHGYEQIAPGCGNKIQIENPDKKELLVRVDFVFIGGGCLGDGIGES